MKNLATVLRNPNIALILMARLVSNSGTWLISVALSVVIYRYSGGSSLLVGALWIVRLIPALLLPLGGKLADRVGYKRAIVISNLGRMIAVAALALLLTPHTWALSYLVAFLNGVLLNLFRPGVVGMMPTLISSREEQLAANSTAMTADYVAIVVGGLLGGAVAGVGAEAPLLLGLAAAYGLVAVSMRFVRARSPRAAVGAPPPELDRGFVAGIRMLTKRPILVFAAAIMVLPELVQGAMLVWIVPYSVHSLHLGSAGSGLLYAALGIGLVLGGFVAGLMGKGIALDRLLAGGILAGGIAIVVFGLWPLAAPALVLIAIFGLTTTVEYAAYETLIQQAVPQSMIGQAVGTMESLFYVMMLLGNAASGILAAAFGIGPSIVVLGILVILTTVGGWLYLQRQLSRLPSQTVMAAIPAFAALPAEIRQWVALRMVRESFPTGATIVRYGDAGETFYAIASGKAEVEVPVDGGVSRRAMGPGEFFGEIALLHNVPRTATVRALEHLTAYTLSRGDLQELQEREAHFKRSLMEIAASRLEQDTSPSLAFGTTG